METFHKGRLYRIAGCTIKTSTSVRSGRSAVAAGTALAEYLACRVLRLPGTTMRCRTGLDLANPLETPLETPPPSRICQRASVQRTSVTSHQHRRTATRLDRKDRPNRRKDRRCDDRYRRDVGIIRNGIVRTGIIRTRRTFCQPALGWPRLLVTRLAGVITCGAVTSRQLRRDIIPTSLVPKGA